MRLSPPRQLCYALLACTIAARSQSQVVRPVAVHRTATPNHVIESPSNHAVVPEGPSPQAALDYGHGIGGGVIGGMLGMVGGAVAGAASAHGCYGDYCALFPAIAGVVAGEAVGIGLGTHFGSGAPGNGFLTTAAPVAVMGAVLLANRGRSGMLLALTPALQIGAALAVERTTSGPR